MPKAVDTRKHCKVGLRACNNLPQPRKTDVGRGLRKIVACSQPYLAVLSCIYSFWHGVIPTSYFIFDDFYTCFTPFFHGKGHPSLNCMRNGSCDVHIRIFTYVHARSAAIGSCDDEYGALLNGNRSGGLGSCLVKVPGLFCIQRIMHARK